MKQIFSRFRLPAGHPIAQHVKRSWKHLQMASRRPLETNLLGLIFFYFTRILHAQGHLPDAYVISPNPLAVRLAASFSDFLSMVWFGPLFWEWALPIAVLAGFAGLFQLGAVSRGYASRLLPKAEDDDLYLTYVPLRVLFLDIALRRIGMVTGFLFFLTITAQLWVQAGIYSAVISGFLAAGCAYVDTKLFRTWENIKAAVRDAQQPPPHLLPLAIKKG